MNKRIDVLGSGVSSYGGTAPVRPRRSEACSPCERTIGDWMMPHRRTVALDGAADPGLTFNRSYSAAVYFYSATLSQSMASRSRCRSAFACCNPQLKPSRSYRLRGSAFAAPTNPGVLGIHPRSENASCGLLAQLFLTSGTRSGYEGLEGL